MQCNSESRPCTRIAQSPDLEPFSKLLEDFCRIPSVSKCQMFEGKRGLRVALEISQRDLPSNSTRKAMTEFLLDDTVWEGQSVETSFPIELKDVLFTSMSPSGRKMLIGKAGEDKNSATLQMWNRVGLDFELVVPEEVHGKLVHDGWFGCGASWSPDESLVAYVAEDVSSSFMPDWTEIGKSKEEKATKEVKPKGWKGVGEYVDDWGEGNTGKKASRVYVLDVEEQKVSKVAGLDQAASYGQPVWAPDSNHLIFVEWKHAMSNFPSLRTKLGIVYCFNRPCRIVGTIWPQNNGGDESRVMTLCSTNGSSYSPRFASDGYLFFLSQGNAVKSGVHSATPSLYKLEWEHIVAALNGRRADLDPHCLVDTVYSTQSADDFPGLYCNLIQSNNFGEYGEQFILLTVQWRSTLAIVAVDKESGHVSRLSPNNASSWTLLAAKNDWVLAMESCPSSPGTVHIGRASDKSNPTSMKWLKLSIPDLENYPSRVRKALRDIRHETLEMSEGGLAFEATVIHNGERRPTMLVPHGGPHTAYSSQFVSSISYMVACGYNIVTVNYRGSTGFGEDSIQSLPGNIGDHDVKDCMKALDMAIQKGHVLEDRVAAVGGSHGGFLSSHLVGQYPDRFKAAVLRNPVCNISQMVHLSDIPDWCYIETFGSAKGLEKASACIQEEDLLAMLRKSPVSFVHQVKAPVLMLLGACDRRVPMDDGKRYIDRLRSLDNVDDARTIVFPSDAHGLTKPQTEFEQWITALWWLRKYVV